MAVQNVQLSLSKWAAAPLLDPGQFRKTENRIPVLKETTSGLSYSFRRFDKLRRFTGDIRVKTPLGPVAFRGSSTDSKNRFSEDSAAIFKCNFL
jgi:hypothetical protein